MSDMYVFQGIDKNKTIDHALKKSNEEAVLVHLHFKGADESERYMHRLYEQGKLTMEWGTIDGSALAPVH
jgi:hypothetical protein